MTTMSLPIKMSTFNKNGSEVLDLENTNKTGEGEKLFGTVGDNKHI